MPAATTVSLVHARFSLGVTGRNDPSGVRGGGIRQASDGDRQGIILQQLSFERARLAQGRPAYRAAARRDRIPADDAAAPGGQLAVECLDCRPAPTARAPAAHRGTPLADAAMPSPMVRNCTTSGDLIRKALVPALGPGFEPNSAAPSQAIKQIRRSARQQRPQNGPGRRPQPVLMHGAPERPGNAYLSGGSMDCRRMRGSETVVWWK